MMRQMSSKLNASRVKGLDKRVSLLLKLQLPRLSFHGSITNQVHGGHAACCICNMCA